MKKLFGTMVVAAAMFASYSAYDAQNERRLSDTVLANIEALANNESMTQEEYQEKTGCTAVWEDTKCKGKDGKTYTYSIEYTGN